MSIARRGRSLTVIGFLIAGGIGIISSTQTWLTVTRSDAGEAILVPGAEALALLAPLSLAVLALGAALTLTGNIVRQIFAALGLFFGVLLTWWTAEILIELPPSAVASSVTETTGLAGSTALDAIVDSISASAWPVLALAGWVLLIVASGLGLATAHRWRRGGSRFRTTDAAHAAEAGPVDAVDSWDDLSRGTDPTR